MSVYKFVSASLLGCVLPLAGCADLEEEDAASAQVTLIDQRSDAITAANDIEWINGTYTNCSGRTGSWSLAVTGSPTMTNSALSVIKGNTNCTLAITHVKTGTDGLVAANTPVALAATYGTAQSFGSPVIKFYANAQLNSVAFSGNFTLTLLFSDDPRTAADSKTATYATVSATASATGVTAPNYTMDLSGVAVTTDINKSTDSVTGNIALTAGSTTGEYYVITNGAVTDTYAAIKAAYELGSPVAMATSIAASSVLATSVSLSSPVVRSLIISKTTSGVTSYQKFEITFNGPS